MYATRTDLIGTPRIVRVPVAPWFGPRLTSLRGEQCRTVPVFLCVGGASPVSPSPRPACPHVLGSARARACLRVLSCVLPADASVAPFCCRWRARAAASYCRRSRARAPRRRAARATGRVAPVRVATCYARFCRCGSPSVRQRCVRAVPVSLLCAPMPCSVVPARRCQCPRSLFACPESPPPCSPVVVAFLACRAPALSVALRPGRSSPLTLIRRLVALPWCVALARPARCPPRRFSSRACCVSLALRPLLPLVPSLARVSSSPPLCALPAGVVVPSPLPVRRVACPAALRSSSGAPRLQRF